jgi:hypothetical protein
MLIALLLGCLFLGSRGADDASLWFFGGQTVQQMNVQLESAVPEASRNAVSQTLGQIEQDYKNLQAERKSLEKDVLAAMEQHDTPPAQFEALKTRAEAINASAGKNMLDQRFKLRGQLSDVQWGLLFQPPAAPTSH